MSNLMTAISTAYDEEEKRSFVKKRALALAMTIGAIVFLIVLLALVAVFPVIDDLIDNSVVRFLLQVARWVLIAALVTGALAVLYRVAPDRDAPNSLGVGGRRRRDGALAAGLARLLDLRASFGNYARTYGAIAGIVVVLLWLWITLVRDPARRGDQRRVRAADRPRHHQGARSPAGGGAPSRPTPCPTPRRSRTPQKGNEPRRTR